jgi:2,5-diamino-6-(ribosylamino)-4(3H)-pyrimidinone 5'-phosphate reductase
VGAPAAGELYAGSDASGHVDLRRALKLLESEFGAATVRVESGGELVGALLRATLVDEVSLVVHPIIVGAGNLWCGATAIATTELDLIEARPLDGGLSWL